MIPSKEQIVRKRTKRMPDWETDPEVVACEAHRDSSKKVMTWERHPKKGPTKFHKKLQVLQSSGWDWGERLYISIMLLSWESDQNGRAVTRRQRAQNGVTYVKTHQDLRPGLAEAWLLEMRPLTHQRGVSWSALRAYLLTDPLKGDLAPNSAFFASHFPVSPPSLPLKTLPFL